MARVKYCLFLSQTSSTTPISSAFSQLPCHCQNPCTPSRSRVSPFIGHDFVNNFLLCAANILRRPRRGAISQRRERDGVLNQSSLLLLETHPFLLHQTHTIPHHRVQRHFLMHDNMFACIASTIQSTNILAARKCSTDSFFVVD